ncbi:MAG: pre-16S rRNA-processing nuclease YqgF [Microcoleaceae cyanobacterium]
MTQNKFIFLGFDPGKDKCGVAVADSNLKLYDHQVIASSDAIISLQSLMEKFPIHALIMGNQTTSKTWENRLKSGLSLSIPIIKVDERYSSLEARDRYWQMYPPQGLTRLIPQGMRNPPRPVDDLVAIILIERYLQGSQDSDSIKD